MREKIEMLVKDFQHAFQRIPAEAEKLRPQHIRVLADLGSVITAALSIETLSGNKVILENKTKMNIEDCIVDELEGADRKYMEYIKTNDPALLNMAKDELRHAGYYLSQARMSPDHELVQRLKEYQTWYAQIEGKINENPHE